MLYHIIWSFDIGFRNFEKWFLFEKTRIYFLSVSYPYINAKTTALPFFIPIGLTSHKGIQGFRSVFVQRLWMELFLSFSPKYKTGRYDFLTFDITPTLSNFNRI